MGKKAEFDKVNDNLQKGKWYAAIANFIAALLFFVAYSYYNDVLFLIAGLILIIAGVGIFIVFSVFSQKLNKAYSKTNPKEHNE
jgi:ABC-type bacteriocin/lantibiotic exporter with double-glycine peptidase domain